MVSNRTIGYAGLGWALSYLPIHIYWAVGGRSTPIGIDGTEDGFRAANWGACLVILGAGLTCVALVQPWGELVPRAVRSGAAWIGGAFAIAHWLLYTTYCALRLTGAIGYPTDLDQTPEQLRRFDWWNVGYFELWFGLMGVLLIVCALRTRLGRNAARVPVPSVSRNAGTALVLAGVVIVIWGVFTFDAWVFAGAGPLVIGAGLLTLRLAPGSTGTRLPLTAAGGRL